MSTNEDEGDVYVQDADIDTNECIITFVWTFKYRRTTNFVEDVLRNPRTITITAPNKCIECTITLSQDSQQVGTAIIDTSLVLPSTLSAIGIAAGNLLHKYQYYPLHTNKAAEWYNQLTLNSDDIRMMTRQNDSGAGLMTCHTVVNIHLHGDCQYIEPMILIARPNITLGEKPSLNRPFSDAVIVVTAGNGVRDIEIPVHRVILADSSPVFHRMFTGGFYEALPASRVCITQASAAAVRAMLQFIYNSDHRIQLNTAAQRRELWDLAEKYEITGLHTLSAILIGRSDLRVGTACDLMNFAERYSNSTLFNMCLRYLQTVSVAVSDDVFTSLSIEASRKAFMVMMVTLRGDAAKKGFLKLLRQHEVEDRKVLI
ncbi:hypothetical protein SeLEV6574_g05150 [Synchytrium endobioticum]|uniref:BTB domain-containing protein n=1 Tax=Synchytrium endobioticum TaxID=286115 RepID=A0A507CVR7_9FUNG|nr:hypothetical protein SeLEV6574_g05150 [Synchytrium endobioticum]